MATMVPPTEESKMQKKKGREALAQATSMVLMVSALIHLYLHQMGTSCTPNNAIVFSFSFFFKVFWQWLRRLRTATDL